MHKQSSSHVLAGWSVQAQRLQAADYEVQKFGLMPRGDNESATDYIARVDRDKTAIMEERWRQRGFKI